MKLSEKEKLLKDYLDGKLIVQGQSQLIDLHIESTTRKYGELAAMKEEVLRSYIDRYLDASKQKI